MEAERNRRRIPGDEAPLPPAPVMEERRLPSRRRFVSVVRGEEAGWSPCLLCSWGGHEGAPDEPDGPDEPDWFVMIPARAGRDGSLARPMHRRVLCEACEPIVQDGFEEQRYGGEGQTNKENNRGK